MHINKSSNETRNFNPLFGERRCYLDAALSDHTRCHQKATGEHSKYECSSKFLSADTALTGIACWDYSLFLEIA